MPNLENDSKPSKLAEYDHAYWMDIYDHYPGEEMDKLIDTLLPELNIDGQAKLVRNNLRFALTELRAATMGDGNRYLVYPRGKEPWTMYQSQTNPNGLSHKFVAVIDALTKHGYLEGVGGFSAGAFAKRSRCRATTKLRDLFARHYIYSSISQHPDTPLVWITDDDNKAVKPKPAWRKAINSSETLLTNYNEFMEEVKVSCTVSLRNWNRSLEHKRMLYRSFKNDMDHEGRFYGPWWQLIPKTQRKHILIENKPTVELDYVCQALHLLYGYYADTNYQATQGNPTPPIDGYLVDGLPRDFTKLMFTVLVGSTSKKRAWAGLRSAIHDKRSKAETNIQKKVEGAEQDYKEAVEWLLYTSTDEECEKCCASFLALHPKLEPFLTQGLSLKLMNIDSFICAHVIETLTKEKVPVLTIHDSFIVQEEHEKRLGEVMREAYQLTYEGKSLSSSFGGIRLESLKDKKRYI